MDEAKLKKLIELFKESGIDEIEFEQSFWRGIKICLRRHPPLAPALPASSIPPLAASPSAAPEVVVGSTEDGSTEGEDDGLHLIKAPMVGTYYKSPSPEADPFVEKGDRVERGQTLALIEAMKIMNEMESDIAGEVVEILVENAQPVEYGQALIKIRPS